MADDTITVNMMPSCGSCKKQPDYAGYKKYTKTWKNLCTSTTCNSKTPGTLQNNPKGTYEGELTCSKCDSDYCGFCGTEKSGSARFKLVSANASTEEDTSTQGNSSSSNYWDMIGDLLKPLDGEVELRVENNRVYVNKIPDPKDSNLWIREGVNITNESITVKDYNPDTPNVFNVTWTGGIIVLKDKYLIDRFGEKPVDLTATKKVTVYEQSSSSDSSSSSSTDTSSTSTSSTSTSSSSSSSSSSTSTSTKSTGTKSTSKNKAHSTAMWIRGKKKVYRSGSVYREVGTNRIYGEKYRWNSKTKKWYWVPKTG